MKQVIAKILGGFINVWAFISAKSAAKMSLKLFSSPRRISIKEKQKDFLETAFIEDVDFGKHSLKTYRWLGKKETILLAHGWESNSFRWKSLILKLNELDYNIVALDAPGHGYSSGRRFNAILYADCIHVIAKKFRANIVIGHSVGGMATAFFQHKYQMESVTKLILLGAPSNFSGVFHRYVDMMGYSKRVAKAMDQLILKEFNYLPEHFNAAKFSEVITAEGLIIHDKTDRIIPYSDAEDFKAFYKKSKLITTEGFGHGLKNVEVDEHIINFING
ncbi:alpha/beta hydrolase [Sediminibacter sp. Hel_I_10]|uniref:alpha/beta hydrolase n=1 Tax=Sediminibacter sp. Hel_I_10 TaxID=1392490 RepID=UPI00047CA30B|nr:alpha/beta hydrolase [Sediminibacter sp. Hel_I_10]